MQQMKPVLLYWWIYPVRAVFIKQKRGAALYCLWTEKKNRFRWFENAVLTRSPSWCPGLWSIYGGVGPGMPTGFLLKRYLSVNLQPHAVINGARFRDQFGPGISWTINATTIGRKTGREWFACILAFFAEAQKYWLEHHTVSWDLSPPTLACFRDMFLKTATA